MIVRASGSGMGVGRFSRPLRGVGVIAMPNAGLDATRRVEVPPGCCCAETTCNQCGGWSIY
jgi:hypothetical protein